MAYHDYDHYERPVYKRYVNVIEYRKKDGTLEPLEIVWDNGKHFKIEKFKFRQFGQSRAGGGGKYYEVWINGQRRKMFLEKDKWFIETEKGHRNPDNFVNSSMFNDIDFTDVDPDKY